MTDAEKRFKEMLDEGLEMKCNTCLWCNEILYAEDEHFGNVLHSACGFWEALVLIRFNFNCPYYLERKKTKND